MLGMTLAMRLRQAGHRVTLLEGADQLGGLASTWRLGDVLWDKHYHVTLLSDASLLAVLGELGLADELRWVETRTGCYTDGRLYSVSNTAEFLRFPPLGIVDKLRLGWTVFHASRIDDWERLEQIPVEDWLVRHSGRRTFDKFWKPLLRSKLGDNYRVASAAFIWAIIQRLYAARRTGLKKEMFGYVEGGYARVLSRFGERLEDLGVEIRLGVRVGRLSAEGDRVKVGIEGDSLLFDKVVVTTAAPIAAGLIEGLTEAERETMTGVTYLGIVCASVLIAEPLAGYYVTNITDGWVPFTGVIEMSALVDRGAFGGRALVYLPRYTAHDDPAATWSDAEVEQRFLDALEKMYPSFDRHRVEAFQISRVRYVLPLSTVGYSKSVPGIATSVPGIFTVNSSQILNGTLNVNETVQLAERAAASLLATEPRTVTAPTSGVDRRP
jgi:protoporphyrinogen oxidase